MLGTVYVKPFWPWQTVFVPVIIPELEGSGFTIIDKFDGVPFPFALAPYTVITPDCELLLKFNVIEFVLLLPVAPLGKDQMYWLAFVIDGTV